MTTAGGASVLRRLGIGLSFLTLLLGIVGQVAYAQEQTENRQGLYVEVDGAINHVTVRFIGRALERAEQEGYEVVVIRVDTPGGLLDATRQIVGDLLEAPVPVVAFVAPAGAHAGSAGTFIVAAAHIAAMAPGTNIGAASPVGAQGEDLPDTLASKATNDAAALIRDVAEERGRNVEALEQTVYEAASFSSGEALELGVVDLIAANEDDLLSAIDGWTVAVQGSDRLLKTDGLALVPHDKSLLERFLTVLADPNLAFLLLSLGSLGLVVELWNPGLFFPGVTGAIFLVLAYLGLGNLPANWAGVVFILLAAVLAVLEVYIQGFGALGVGAIVSFVLGAFLIFAQIGSPSPTTFPVGISPWVLFPTLLIVAAGGGWTLWTAVRSAQRRPEDESHPLLDEVGYATTELNPRGSVQLHGELWSARVRGGGKIEIDSTVRVVEVNGAVATVVPYDESSQQEGS